MSATHTQRKARHRKSSSGQDSGFAGGLAERARVNCAEAARLSLQHACCLKTRHVCFCRTPKQGPSSAGTTTLLNKHTPAASGQCSRRHNNNGGLVSTGGALFTAPASVGHRHHPSSIASMNDHIPLTTIAAHLHPPSGPSIGRPTTPAHRSSRREPPPVWVPVSQHIASHGP